MNGRLRNSLLAGAVLLSLLGSGWGQAVRGSIRPGMSMGTINASTLPPYSASAESEEDDPDEAPSHASMPSFSTPALHGHAQPVQPAATPGTASAGKTPAIAPALTFALASSFNSLTSPSPAVSFQAQPMQGNSPPDTTGAVNANYAVSASNDRIVIQDRLGHAISNTHLNSFWSAFSNVSPAWDPNVRYDPYANRWIIVCMVNYGSGTSGMLIAVSATSDPTGSWYMRRINSDSTSTTFDHPRVGFNKNWIVVTGNQLLNSSGNPWTYSVVYVFDKANLYANGSMAPFEFNHITGDFTLTPALTYDNTVNTMYLMANNSGSTGTLSLSTITGSVDAPVWNPNVAFPTTSNTWADKVGSNLVSQNFAPQLGSSTKIGVFDARMDTVVYRNGSLWATHTVFVPASSPNISAVDWWQVGTDGTVQQFGRLQDTNGSFFYAYPSLAVNSLGDMLIGYTRMTSGQYASGAYAFRAASDAAGTLRGEFVMEAGQASYVKLDGNGVNRWGDYSSTQVDPVNDLDFWTIQEYAGPNSGFSTWALWWANITDPSSSGLVLESVGVNPSSVTGGTSSTGTVTLSNTAPTGGTVVALSSNSASAQVPSSVTVASGQASATFSVTTSSVSSPTTATITASYNGSNPTASLTVNPVLALQAVTVSPSAITGRHTATGTVVLNAAAPSGGVSVGLSSTNSTAAPVPASVTVAAGSTSATFAINTNSVSAATPVTITASYNGVNKTANLTVDPAGAIALSAIQAQQSFNPNSGTSITASISSTSGDLLVAYVREGSSATDNFTVTDNLGQSWTLLGYNTFNSTNRSGIYYRANSGAVSSVTANFTTGGGVVRPGIVVYEIVGAAASSPVVDAGPANSLGAGQPSITSAPLTTGNANDLLLMAVDVAGDQSGTNNSFVPGAGFAFPAAGSATDARQALAYKIVSSTQASLTTSMSWAAGAASSSEFVAFRCDPGSAAASLQSVGVSPSTVTGGSSSTGTVTLTSAAPAGGASVTLSSNSSAATVPPSVNVPGGSTTATFTINTSSVSSSTQVTVTGNYGGIHTAILTVNPAGSTSLSVVQAQQNFNPNAGIPSIAASIGSTAGDLLVAYVREGSSATDNFTVTDNLGQSWTLLGYNTFNSTNRSGIFYRPNSGAVGTVTANFTTGGGVVRAGIVVYEIAGAASSSPVDAGPASNSSGTTQASITSAPLSSQNANDLALFAVDVAGDQSGTNNSFAPGTGFAFAATGAATTVRQAVSYAIVSSLQTNLTTSMSWSVASTASSSQLVFFRAGP